MTVELYHYTCDHGRQAIGLSGMLLPHGLPGGVQLVWLTDMSTPDRRSLGLTSAMLRCDRTQHRYRITDDTGVMRWLAVRRRFHSLGLLELTPGVRPAHWWVSLTPIPAAYDPIIPTVMA